MVVLYILCNQSSFFLRDHCGLGVLYNSGDTLMKKAWARQGSRLIGGDKQVTRSPEQCVVRTT